MPVPGTIPNPAAAEPAALDSALLRRARGGKRQLLARAIGLPRHKNLHVCDATAGFGRDGFLLAGLGATVDLVERNADVFAELQAGFGRLPADWQSRARLFHADAGRLLTTGIWDVVYLDPMYTPSAKHALPKAQAQRLRQLAGDDRDADALLDIARRHARLRVVVKRASRAAHLAGQEPHQCLSGNRVRFDLYLPLVAGS